MVSFGERAGDRTQDPLIKRTTLQPQAIDNACDTPGNETGSWAGQRPIPQTDSQTRDQGHSYVYIFVAGPYVKVGVAHNPEARATEIKVGCPIRGGMAYRLRVERRLREAIEAKTHKLLEKKATKGEWFEVDFIVAYRALLKALAEITEAAPSPLLAEAQGYHVIDPIEQAAHEDGVLRAIAAVYEYRSQEIKPVQIWTPEHFLNGQVIATPLWRTASACHAPVVSTLDRVVAFSTRQR